MEGLTNGAGAGVYGHAGSSSSASYGVYGFSPGGAGVFGYDSTNGAGVLGSSVGGVGVKGVSAGPNAWGGYFTNTATGGWAVSAAATGSTALQAISVSGNRRGSRNEQHLGSTHRGIDRNGARTSCTRRRAWFGQRYRRLL